MNTFFNNLSKAKQKVNREATIAEMRKVGHKHFNMATWCTLDPNEPDLGLDEVGFDILQEPTCGTTACLAGFATQVMPKTTWGRVRRLDCEEAIQRSVAQWLGVAESTFSWNFEEAEITSDIYDLDGVSPHLGMRPNAWLSCWVYQNVDLDSIGEQKAEHEAIIAYLTALNSQ